MIRYELVKLDDDTIYSENKGNKIERRGDTLIITHEANIHGYCIIPWVRVREAEVKKDG